MKYIAQCSGGKDSVATVLLCLEKGYPLDEVIFCDTGMEFPAIYKTLDDVKALCEKHGVKYTVLHGDHSFWYYFSEHELVKGPNKGCHGYGFPSMRIRWCTKILKIAPFKKYVREMYGKEEIMLYLGIAKDEPKRIKEDPYIRYPLVENGMTEADAMQYCKDHGFNFYGHYDIFHRSACWCCPLQKVDECRQLYKHFPDLWKLLLEKEKEKPKRLKWNFKQMKTVADFDRQFRAEEEKQNAKD